jgi:hypothetical protein
VYEIQRSEKDREKRKKLDALELTDNEWDRVRLFLGILAVITFTLDIRVSLH